jgi:transcriptional regulator with XRE-family HTH domain
MENASASQPALAAIIRDRREELGMSQETVSQIERGITTAPRTKTLHRLAGVLGLNVSDLIVAANLARTRADAAKVAESDRLSKDDARASIIGLVRSIEVTRDRERGLKALLLAWQREDRRKGKGGQ